MKRRFILYLFSAALLAVGESCTNAIAQNDQNETSEQTAVLIDSIAILQQKIVESEAEITNTHESIKENTLHCQKRVNAIESKVTICCYK